jgi:hypothetical protein
MQQRHSKKEKESLLAVKTAVSPLKNSAGAKNPEANILI